MSVDRDELTLRDVQVLRCAAKGHQAADSAEELFLSVHTVNYYRKRAMAKLGAHTITHAVVIAYERGLLP